MGLKKYEIITVGSGKRVRALRSWQVGDRYVNIGDVGGIVYDEKTLSQDGACWLFRGNFGFPGARIGGDSIVDVGEATLPVKGSPAVDILGSSVLVGSKLVFESDQTAADAVVLTANDFEQGDCTFAVGSTLNDQKTSSPNVIRVKNPIFMGGVAKTVKLNIPGFAVTIFGLDADLRMVSSTPVTETGEGVILTIPASQYCYIRLRKNPAAATVPADATAAQITFTGTYETKLSIIDSRVEINPATSTGITTIRPGGNYTITPGAKYPEAVIRNSNVSINVPAVTSRSIRLMGQIIGSTATLYATAGDVSVAGQYSNIKNLTASGVLTADLGVTVYNVIQATNCDNFTVSPMIFPGLADATSANMPFIFQGCNVPKGIFYHHAQIANTYKNIDFALAQTDLGKSLAGGRIFASAEVEGMYRLATGVGGLMGSLVESHDSVANLSFNNFATIYDTTIYKDAYFRGLFYFAGTNVFGNAMKHEASNTQVMDTMLYQGRLTSTVGEVPSLVKATSRVSTIVPFRINGPNGILVDNIPAGIDVAFMVCDARGKYVIISTWKASSAAVTNFAQLQNAMAYVTFKKADDTSISVDEVKGVTITTYNGCKIVNTKATAAVIAGNVRVEDNATLIDTNVTGTGYFGGNSIVQAPSALVGQLPIEGAAYMSDNAVFAPSTVNATAGLSLLEMKDNAVFAGNIDVAGTNLNITMVDNAKFFGSINSRSGWTMRGNSYVASAAVVNALCKGICAMKDDARVESGSLTALGHITLCGKYKQTANKVWTGKRVIASQDAPQYDDNVKTKYDF